MKTFEFANRHGRLGSLVCEPGEPPKYWWIGRGEVLPEVRDNLTRGVNDPETGKQVGGDQGALFMECLAVEYGKGQVIAGRRGPDLKELPDNARRVTYTAGVAAWFK